MAFLFIQTGIWLFLVAILGLFVGWLIWGRNRNADCSAIQRQLDDCQKRCGELEAAGSDSITAAESTLSTSNSPDTIQTADLSETEDSDNDSPVQVSDDMKPVFLLSPMVTRMI